MTQLWAIVARSGSYALRYTNGSNIRPDDDGQRAECRSRNIWALDREPRSHFGETVDFETGAIVFDVDKALAAIVPYIKAWASAEILTVAPYWRQLNDIADPTAAGAVERRSEIDLIRKRSNQLEADVAKADTAAKVEKVWQKIGKV